MFGIGGAHELETWAEAGEARQTRIDGKSATQLGLGRILRVLWLVPAMTRLWIEAAEGRRRFSGPHHDPVHLHLNMPKRSLAMKGRCVTATGCCGIR